MRPSYLPSSSDLIFFFFCVCVCSFSIFFGAVAKDVEIDFFSALSSKSAREDRAVQKK